MPRYYFSLPSFDALTPPQRSAVNDLNAIAISGPAGSGKSVVSLYRHLRSENSQLLTFTRTLAIFLSECCRLQNVNAAEKTCSIHSWIWRYLQASPRREIIIDEAQDLGYAYIDGTHLTWRKQSNEGVYYDRINIHRDYFSQRGCKISYGADNAQCLNSEGITQEELRETYPLNTPRPLARNFRNSKKIMQFTQACFPEANLTDDYITSCGREGDKPIFIKTSNDMDIILEKIEAWTAEDQNIAVLFLWKKDIKRYYECIKERFPDATYFASDNDVSMTLSNIHFTTFKSAKGLEFDTVIIPNFNKRFQDLERFNITWRDYYVGVTRARTNLYLLDNNSLPFDIRSFVDEE